MARYIFYLAAAILISCCTCQSTNETLARSSASRFGELNNYFLYTRDNPREPVRVYATAASASATRTLRTKTVIIVHDHAGSYATSLNPTVKDAFLTSEDVSVIVVDWSLIAGSAYDVAVAAVPEVGSGIANMVRFMVNARRITLDNLHLVGFGLGAHVVAFTARALTTGTVARITALDPVAASWDSSSDRLRNSDANYVEVIHTDASSSGITEAIGTVDFYPNGGITQQGCSAANSTCNHNRAWELFAATLTHTTLVGNQCDQGASPSDANCRGYSLIMGNNELDKYGSGSYFAVTSDKYPYHSELNCVLTCLD